MNDYNFGNFVCQLREQKGLTQADIAQELGVTPAAVSKWENGSSKPRVEILFRLAQILDARPEELMAGHHIVEETLNTEAIKQINERYEYLRRIEMYNTTRAKIRRIFAWIIDWNIIGSIVLLAVAVFFALFKDELESESAFVIVVSMLLILSYPILFVLRDFIMGGRSLGKRILGLAVLDLRTGEKAKISQCMFRNIFLVAYYVDIIMMLATGRSLGDRVAHTVVICKKDLNSDTNIVTPSDMRDRIEKINSYTNNIPSAKARRKKKLIITFSIIGGVVLFVGLILCVTLIGLNAEKSSDEYKLAYEYVVESQEFERLGSNEDRLTFLQYSKETVYGKDGQYKSTVLVGFNYGLFKRLEVICHDDGAGWYVCTDCTKFD
ncbi:MAG: helix-turn-helix domain-containing protein [Ruminococcaceae bacterium]|nr:helix-turn-helix domain-containing protein [Oscillospiraceae bacterium]